jgi:hypothetical protein
VVKLLPQETMAQAGAAGGCAHQLLPVVITRDRSRVELLNAENGASTAMLSWAKKRYRAPVGASFGLAIIAAAVDRA